MQLGVCTTTDIAPGTQPQHTRGTSLTTAPATASPVSSHQRLASRPGVEPTLTPAPNRQEHPDDHLRSRPWRLARQHLLAAGGPLLAAAGHRAVTPELTGHGAKSHLLTPEIGLSTHVQDVVDALEEEDLADVVLVGHSYAGMVISGVAERAPGRVARLVFVDAMVPEDGENAIDVMPVTQLMIDGAAHSREPWRIPPLPEFPAPVGLFGVTDAADMAWLRPTLGDDCVRSFQERVRLVDPDAAAIDRVHVHCVGSEPVGFTRRPVPASDRNGRTSRSFEIRTGHDCMVTAPGELVDILVATM